MKTTRKAGFTIVELLVVITIIGILMALLFPAVNSIREQARRVQCTNNQRQLGQAINSYAASKGEMPPVESYVPGKTGVRFNWVHPILPYIGRNDIYEILTSDQPPVIAGTPTTPDTFLTYIDLLVCPSDPPGSKVGTAPLNYAANAGVNSSSGGTNLWDCKENGALSDAIVVPPVVINLGYIASKDGVSNTILLSENVDAADWNSVDAEYKTTILWRYSAGSNLPTAWSPDPVTYLKPTQTMTFTYARPSSRHPGGFLVTFCDGHIQFFKNDVSYGVYCLLMTSYGMGAKKDKTTTSPPDPAWQGTPVNESMYSTQ